jgi:DNA-binding NtrC family response regulator
MVLQDVGALCPEEQRRLLNWLEESGGRTQVVSTSAEPLLARVTEGSFLDTLYYRLNTVCVETSRAC